MNAFIIHTQKCSVIDKKRIEQISSGSTSILPTIFSRIKYYFIQYFVTAEVCSGIALNMIDSSTSDQKHHKNDLL